MEKIVLTKEKETLLIPLYCKAREQSKKSPVIVDSRAALMVASIDYDFQSLDIPKKTVMTLCLRAKLIDDFTRDFLAKGDETVVVHLGCGLDSRYDRIQDKNVDWYDVDFPDVIDIRKKFFPENRHYHMVPSSVTDSSWLNMLPKGKERHLVIAEGLFMYLKEDDIKILLSRLYDQLGNYTLIFDAFSNYTVHKINRHPSIQKTGAVIQWGIDEPEALSKLIPGTSFLKTIYFTANKEVNRMGVMMRILYGIANMFAVVRNSQRLLCYRVG